MDKYLKAIKQNVCTICVDSNESGGCTLNKNESCAVELFLPKIIDVVHSTNNYETMEAIHKKLKDTICVECRAQENGNCSLHNDANCSLDRYYWLIVEVIQKVDAGKL